MHPDKIALLQRTVLEYYDMHGRHDMPWRQPDADGSFDPYKIVVSELMLQQTQVGRVIPKYQAFLKAFPTFHTLAHAPLSEVLTLWSGLGYNRRAKFLWHMAQAVVWQYKGRLPQTRPELLALPGIGPGTAGAILAYAYNQPVSFIETNIRTVFIHHLFSPQNDTKISDAQLMPLVASAVPPGQARQWYWALMDYGAYLKRTHGNAARSSTAYVKQSAFHGSRRYVRGQVLKTLIRGPMTLAQLCEYNPDERVAGVLEDLIKEGFIVQNTYLYHLAA